MFQYLARMWKDQSGATAIEYALLASGNCRCNHRRCKWRRHSAQRDVFERIDATEISCPKVGCEAASVGGVVASAAKSPLGNARRSPQRSRDRRPAPWRGQGRQMPLANLKRAIGAIHQGGPLPRWRLVRVLLQSGRVTAIKAAHHPRETHQ